MSEAIQQRATIKGSPAICCQLLPLFPSSLPFSAHLWAPACFDFLGTTVIDFGLAKCAVNEHQDRHTHTRTHRHSQLLETERIVALLSASRPHRWAAELHSNSCPACPAPAAAAEIWARLKAHPEPSWAELSSVQRQQGHCLNALMPAICCASQTRACDHRECDWPCSASLRSSSSACCQLPVWPITHKAAAGCFLAQMDVAEQGAA